MPGNVINACRARLGHADHRPLLILGQCETARILVMLEASEPLKWLFPVARSLACVGEGCHARTRINCASRNDRHVFGLSLDTLSNPQKVTIP